MTATRKPGLGKAPRLKDAAEFDKWAQRVTEIIQVYEGVKGDRTKLDRVVTWRDFEDAGFDLAAAGAGGSGSGGSGGSGAVPPYTAPSAPTGLAITPGFSCLFLRWDVAEYFYLSHTEIWRAEVDNLGDAVKVLDATGNMAADQVGASSPVYFYWIRYVSTSGQVGPWNAVAGVSGQTALDPEILLNALTGQLTESQLYQDLVDRIDLIEPLGASLSTVQDRLNNTDGTGLSLEGLALEVQTLVVSGGSGEALAQSAYNKAVALETRAGDVGGTGVTLETLGINFESLSSQISNPATGLSALATAVNDTQTQVTSQGGDLTTLANNYSGLSAILASAQGDIAAQSSSLNIAHATISTIAGVVNGHTTSINQISTTVNGHTAAIELEAETRANDVGQLNAKYTLRLDVNGRVVGWTANNNGQTGELIVVADKFAIAPVATDPGADDGAPFYHLTAPTEIDGVLVPAGTYMKAAYIADATITNAKIGSVSVDKITGDVAEFIQGNFNELKSTNFNEVGRTGFQLSVNGAHKIFGGAGSEVVANEIRSNNYVSGLSGFRLAADGFFEARNAYVRGDVEATSIKADAANVVSTLHLRGNAVTIANSDYVIAAGLPAGVWVTVLTITFDFSGASAGQAVQVLADLTTTHTDVAPVVGTEKYTRVAWSLTRNGVEVMHSDQVSAIVKGGGTSDGVNFSLYRRFALRMDAPGSGIHTYRLNAYVTLKGSSYYLALTKIEGVVSLVGAKR